MLVLVIVSFTGLGQTRAATAVPRLHIDPPKVCWVHTTAGYTPKVTLTATPTEKLEALALNVQFQGAGQPGVPLLALQYDAEAHLHYS